MTLDQAFWTLGIKDRNITEAELKKIYRKNLRLVHPDAATSDMQDLANEKASELNEAYDIIHKYRESQNWSVSGSSSGTYGQSSTRDNTDYREATNRAKQASSENSGERARQAQERARREAYERAEREAYERAEREAYERARQAAEAERNRDHSKDTFTPQQAYEKIKGTKLLAKTLFFAFVSFAAILSIYEWLVSADKANYIIRNCSSYLTLLSFYLAIAIVVRLWKQLSFNWGCIGIGIKVILAALLLDWITLLAEKLIINLGVVGMAAIVVILLVFDRNTVKKAIHIRKDNPYPPEKKIAEIFLAVYCFSTIIAIIWIVLRIIAGLLL